MSKVSQPVASGKARPTRKRPRKVVRPPGKKIAKKTIEPTRDPSIVDLANDSYARGVLGDFVNTWSCDLAENFNARKWGSLRGDLRALMLLVECMVAFDEKCERHGFAPNAAEGGAA